MARYQEIAGYVQRRVAEHEAGDVIAHVFAVAWRRFLAAMDRLRPADREALRLVLWDDLSHADAAAVLGCSVNAFELRYRYELIFDPVTSKLLGQHDILVDPASHVRILDDNWIVYLASGIVDSVTATLPASGGGTSGPPGPA